MTKSDRQKAQFAAVRYQTPPKIDLVEAQRLLDEGESVLTVALSQSVAAQSIYYHIERGRLVRPEKERT